MWYFFMHSVSRSGELKLTPQWRHAAVPDQDVIFVYNYMNEKKATFLQALQALHGKLFPEGYTPYPFKQCKYQGHPIHSNQSDINEKKATFLQALQALHSKLFPEGYTPYPFKQCKCQGQPKHCNQSKKKLCR